MGQTDGPMFDRYMKPAAHTTFVCILVCTVAGSDLGFYKGWCPTHLKGAPEVKHVIIAEKGT